MSTFNSPANDLPRAPAAAAGSAGLGGVRPQAPCTRHGLQWTAGIREARCIIEQYSPFEQCRARSQVPLGPYRVFLADIELSIIQALELIGSPLSALGVNKHSLCLVFEQM